MQLIATAEDRSSPNHTLPYQNNNLQGASATSYEGEIVNWCRYMQIVWPPLHCLCIKANVLGFDSKHHQVSVMKFTSLITMIISAAWMAGVAIASDNLVITPMGLPCGPPDIVGCATGIKGWNNDDDYGYFCGPQGTIIYYEACSCKNCCVVTSDGDAFTCGA
ncbi:hypothetical protein EDB19DRAFT_177827 [Suillus lakei]|nr:hypothetical protein EDB19DRAFT_177827 [Suillus lakei]